MSQECYDKLVAELRNLITVERRAHGRLLSKIRYKQRILANARVLDTAQRSGDTVQLLCKVEITNLKTNKTATYTIASPHEANIREGKVSMKSPIGQALMNHKIGDVVEVKVPAGVVKLRIESIGL